MTNPYIKYIKDDLSKFKNLSYRDMYTILEFLNLQDLIVMATLSKKLRKMVAHYFQTKYETKDI